MGDHDYLNGAIITNGHNGDLVTGDVLVHREDHDIISTSDGIKALYFGDGDKGDDTSTTSSGVSSGESSGIGSTTISMSSGSTLPSPDKDKKKFDVSLNSWNIWQEDADFAPPSDEEDEGISTSSGLRRFKSADFSTTESTKKRLSGFFRRFSLRDSHEVSAPKRQSIELTTVMPSEVRVDTLPQYFVVKHLGSRRASGLFGSQHVRKPVDEMVGAVGNLRRGQQLTLAQIHVTKKGIHLSSHNDNKGPNLPAEFIPLEFVSYGAQDGIHTRIFCLVLVRTVSRHAKKAECHAFSCNCSGTAKKLALSVALAFKKYAAALKDKPHKFEVDLDKGLKRESTNKNKPRAEFEA